MHGNTRPQYEALRKRLERPLDLLVVPAALATIPIVIAQELGETQQWIVIADWAVWSIFVLDFGLLGFTAANRARYCLRNILGLLIVVVSFPLLPDLLASIRVVRIARAVRLLRLIRVSAVLLRSIRSLRRMAGVQSVIYMGALTLTLAALGAGLLVVLEPRTVNHSFLDGLWWALVTVSTVGYGDITPQTLLGRLLAVVLMLSGLGLLSTLAAAVSAYFIGEDVKLIELRDRLERIEAILEEMRATDRRRGPGD